MNEVAFSSFFNGFRIRSAAFGRRASGLLDYVASLDALPESCGSEHGVAFPIT